MNGDARYAEHDEREMAYALVDRTLTAIGGLEHEDPLAALDLVLVMYERALAKLRE